MEISEQRKQLRSWELLAAAFSFSSRQSGCLLNESVSNGSSVKPICRRLRTASLADQKGRSGEDAGSMLEEATVSSRINRQAAWDDRERSAQAVFLRRLAAIGSWKELKEFIDAGQPRVGEPGRHLLANLGFFAGGFRTPSEATSDELLAYATLIRRLDAAGELKAGSADGIISRLRSDAESR